MVGAWLPDRDDLEKQAITEVLTYAWQVFHGLDTTPQQLLPLADARQHKQLGRVEGSS